MNPLTTDFSLQASGFKIESNCLSIHNTIAANYLEMMNSIVALGNDGRQDLNNVRCSSLYVENLAISGGNYSINYYIHENTEKSVFLFY
ncbi:MAG: metallopeptidase TldD-related protein [Holdemania massiliensis]